jgi:hypothetical protein
VELSNKEKTLSTPNYETCHNLLIISKYQDMKTQITVVKNLGGRPPKITEEMVWEVIRIKGEYGIGDWKKTIIVRNYILIGVYPTTKTVLQGFTELLMY